MQIENVTAIPSGKTGFAITFLSPFSQGRVNALGRVKGLYYKERNKNPKAVAAIRYSASLAEDDPYTLYFTCDGCTDHELMQRELLLVLVGINLIPKGTTRLPGLDPLASPKPGRNAKGHFLPKSAQAT